MNLFNKKTSNRGFTIIEMIVTISVLGILVLLGTPRLLSYTQKTELTRIQHDTKVMEQEMGILMVENEVDIGGWGNNNKNFNQLIVEDKLFEKEGVAERIYTNHLTHNGVLNLSKYFRETTSSNKTASLSDDELGIGGESYPVNELPEDFSVDKTYKVIPEEYSKKINTKLKGTFYVNSDGKVYYEHEKPIPGEDKDKLITCPTAFPDYKFEHETGTIDEWYGTEQYLTIPSHFLVDGKCWPVRIIGVGAFANGNFRRVVIPDTVVKIERDAFKDATIDEVLIPHSVEHIADGAFSGGRIDKVEVVGEPGRFEPGVFVDTEPTFRRPTPQELDMVIHPESGTIVSSTNNNNNQYQSDVDGGVGGTLIIPEQVEVPGRNEPVRIEKIHKGAFQGEGLIEVHMPYTLRRIEAYAFAGNQLNEVKIPQSIEYIGEYAFAFNQHIHSSNNKVSPTIKSIKINDIERINNVEAGNIVDNSGTLINPLDVVEMKEYIWVTDADNFKFEEIDPTGPENPTGPGEPVEKEPVYSDEEIRGLIAKGYIPIATAEELNNVRNVTLKTYGKGTEWEGEYLGGLGKRYVQVANIDLSGHSEKGWNPIGTSPASASFKGTYDGGNYVITGLEVKGKGKNYQGLFGRTERATIRNVGLIDNKIIGEIYVGGLVGYAVSSTKISNSYATGSVTGSGNHTGGLVGRAYNGTTISNSYATGQVTGTDYVGGLVGGAIAGIEISNSYSTGSVTGSDYVGGILGDAHNNNVIRNSYSTGEVTGTDRVGGLVGNSYQSNTISNSYATGPVKGSNNVGGLVGYAQNGAKIRNTYATGSATGTDRVGGLVGYIFSSEISNSYVTGSVEGSGEKVGGLVGYAQVSTIKRSSRKTTDAMKKRDTYSDWNFDTIWKIDEGNDYPKLR